MFLLDLDEHQNPQLMQIKTVPVDKQEAANVLETALSRLNNIYRQVPGIVCDCCGDCCHKAGSPQLTSIEFINISNFLSLPEHKETKKTIYTNATIVKVFINKKKKKHPEKFISYICPAFDSQAQLCLIQDRKPLCCRLFGLKNWQKENKVWIKTGMEPENKCDNHISSCNKTKIKQDIDATNWDYDTNRIVLTNQCRALSKYYYWDKNAEKLFNEEAIINWFSLNLCMK